MLGDPRLHHPSITRRCCCWGLPIRLLVGLKGGDKLLSCYYHSHDIPQLVGYPLDSFLCIYRQNRSFIEMGNQTIFIYPPGNQHILSQGTFEHDVPFLPKVGSVCFLGGIKITPNSRFSNKMGIKLIKLTVEIWMSNLWENWFLVTCYESCCITSPFFCDPRITSCLMPP